MDEDDEPVRKRPREVNFDDFGQSAGTSNKFHYHRRFQSFNSKGCFQKFVTIVSHGPEAQDPIEEVPACKVGKFSQHSQLQRETSGLSSQPHKKQKVEKPEPDEESMVPNTQESQLVSHWSPPRAPGSQGSTQASSQESQGSQGSQGSQSFSSKFKRSSQTYRVQYISGSDSSYRDTPMGSLKQEGRPPASVHSSIPTQPSGRRLCIAPGSCDIKASSSPFPPKKKKKPPVKAEPSPQPQTKLVPPKKKADQKQPCSQSQPPPNKFYVDNFQQTQPSSFFGQDEISSISPKIDLNSLPNLPRRGSFSSSDEDFQRPKKKQKKEKAQPGKGKKAGIVIDLVGIDSD